ncbi:MAG: polysaccharide deacetylase family protein [Planctomycetota bacterium]
MSHQPGKINEQSPVAERSRPEEPECLVAMYHYVRPRESGEHTGIHAFSPDEFQHQLEALLRCFDPISWPIFFAWHRGLATLPGKCVLFSFDDGLKDHSRYVEPILSDFGISGLFFVPGEVLTQPVVLGAHAAHLLISTLGADGFGNAVRDALESMSPGTAHLTPAQQSDARKIYHYEEATMADLKYLVNFHVSAETRGIILDQLFETHIGPQHEFSSRIYMGWDDLTRLEGRGHTIGSHGFSHDPLAPMDRRRRDADVCRMSDLMLEGLGPAPRPVSYPFGSVNAEVAEACAKAGFVQGFTTRHAWSTPADDPMMIPRIDANRVVAETPEAVSCP